MAENEFKKFITEQNELIDNMRAQFLRKLLKNQQTESSRNKGIIEVEFI
ncbi:unnamed protein product [Paramecium sonneborni]|uniref:Uncharacterized protein n=1 Tax=Paramecium sonneborni TaxID=65129 RepID=A0A8S1P296_9CILI|nr:unnamed protein product [Paramecium sonneborni]